VKRDVFDSAIALHFHYNFTQLKLAILTYLSIMLINNVLCLQK